MRFCGALNKFQRYSVNPASSYLHCHPRGGMKRSHSKRVQTPIVEQTSALRFGDHCALHSLRARAPTNTEFRMRGHEIPVQNVSMIRQGDRSIA